jgi:hypothetical protein
MKRKLIATLAAGAALAAQPLTPPSCPLSLHAAMEIAQKEIVRRGLAATNHVSAFYAGEDRQTEGAAFAAIVRPHLSTGAPRRSSTSAPRLKLLIHDDGHTTLQTIATRVRIRA